MAPTFHEIALYTVPVQEGQVNLVVFPFNFRLTFHQLEPLVMAKEKGKHDEKEARNRLG